MDRKNKKITSKEYYEIQKKHQLRYKDFFDSYLSEWESTTVCKKCRKSLLISDRFPDSNPNFNAEHVVKCFLKNRTWEELAKEVHQKASEKLIKDIFLLIKNEREIVAKLALDRIFNELYEKYLP